MLIVINALILSVFFLCFFGTVMCGDSTVQLKLENFVSFLHLPTLELKKYSCVCYDDKCKLDSSIS